MTTVPLKFSAERLRAARGDRRPEELALAADVSAQTIRNWENGTYEPDATSLARIAAHLGVAIESFFVPQEAA